MDVGGVEIVGDDSERCSELELAELKGSGLRDSTDEDNMKNGGERDRAGDLFPLRKGEYESIRRP